MNPSELARQEEAAKTASCPTCGESIPRAYLPITIPDDEDEEDDDPDRTPDFEE